MISITQNINFATCDGISQITSHIPTGSEPNEKYLVIGQNIFFFIFQCPKPGIYLFPVLKGETIHTIDKKKYIYILTNYTKIYYHIVSLTKQ